MDLYQWIKQHVSVWQHRHLVEDTGTLSPWELLLWALVWAFMCRASCSLVELWRFMPRISFCQGYVLKRIEMLQLARCQAKPKDWYHDILWLYITRRTSCSRVVTSFGMNFVVTIPANSSFMVLNNWMRVLSNLVCLPKSSGGTRKVVNSMHPVDCFLLQIFQATSRSGKFMISRDQAKQNRRKLWVKETVVL